MQSAPRSPVTMLMGPYLRRLGLVDSPPPPPNRATLCSLHRAHMLRIPFENLDVHLRRRIPLSLPAAYVKIVERGRGGFCYELNGIFAWLLRSLGFAVDLIGAQVFDEDGQAGPEKAHVCLLLHDAATGQRDLVDVGFGDGFIEPLPLGHTRAGERARLYRTTEKQGMWTLGQRQPGGPWVEQYQFTLTPHALEDFGPMCRWQQEAAESIFTKKSVCTRAQENGRITISNGRLITTTGAGDNIVRSETQLSSVLAYQNTLVQHFGFDLEGEEFLPCLIGPPAPHIGRP